MPLGPYAAHAFHADVEGCLVCSIYSVFYLMKLTVADKWLRRPCGIDESNGIFLGFLAAVHTESCGSAGLLGLGKSFAKSLCSANH